MICVCVCWFFIIFFCVCFKFLPRFSKSWSNPGRFKLFFLFILSHHNSIKSDQIFQLKMVTNKIFVVIVVEIRILSIRRQDPKSLKMHLYRPPSQSKHLRTRIAHNRSHRCILLFHSIRYVDWCMGIWIGVYDLRNLPIQAYPFQLRDCTSISWPFVMNKSDCSTCPLPSSPPYSFALT